MQQKKILLAQLNSNGDCLYLTVVAKQIKEVDYPGCRLTWAVNSKCKQSIVLNPHIDEIWEVPAEKSLSTDAEWEAFVTEAEKRKAAGEFDEIFYTQIIGEKALVCFDGGIRSTHYLLYPHPIKINQQTILRLSEEEVNVVTTFAETHRLSSFKNILLMECGPDSFTSALNPQSATVLAHELTKRDPSLAVILSSNKKIENTSASVIDGSILNYRANAELTKYCTLLAGCSSGISWLAETDWAKPLPKVLVINADSYRNSSMVYDHTYAGLPHDHIIELKETENSIEDLRNCVTEIIKGNFTGSKTAYHTDFGISNYQFMYDIFENFLDKRQKTNAWKFAWRVMRRNYFSKKTASALLQQYKKAKAARKLRKRNAA